MSLLVFLAAAALSGPAPTVAEAVVTPPEAKMICRRERATGSHRTERVCRTAGQEKAEMDAKRRLGSALMASDRGKMEYKPVVGRQ